MKLMLFTLYDDIKAFTRLTKLEVHIIAKHRPALHHPVYSQI
jgi:hypothetical protein